MADVQVGCVKKTGTTHQAITHLGGTGGGGWCWERAKVIESITAGTNTFFTHVDGRRAEILVVDANPRYLQTRADGQWTNNLLALPTCP